MNRRRFLTVVGCVGLSGCTGSETSTKTREATVTETATETPTPTPTTTTISNPELVSANLLTHWEEFGDVRKFEVNAVGKGGNAVVGWRYSLPIHDGKSEESYQVTIYNEEGPSVTSRKGSDQNLTNNAGSDTWERWEGIDTTGWDQGQYSAEVLVRDEVTGKNSETISVDFTVNEPLGKGEANIQSVSTPDSVKVGEQVSTNLTIANKTGRDSSVVSTLSGQYEDSQWQSVSEEKFKMNIAANDSREYKGGTISFDQAGTYSYRLDAIGETWSIEVTE